MNNTKKNFQKDEKDEKLSSDSHAETNNSIFSIENKWGKELTKDGFTAIPNYILYNQSKKKLNNNQMMLIIHIISFWWEKNRNPFPSKKNLSLRMGISERQIQRYISELIQIGALRRFLHINNEKIGRNTLEFDMNHLLDFLKEK